MNNLAQFIFNNIKYQSLIEENIIISIQKSCNYKLLYTLKCPKKVVEKREDNFCLLSRLLELLYYYFKCLKNNFQGVKEF